MVSSANTIAALLAAGAALGGDFATAIATGARAVALNQGDFSAHYNLACALAQNGQPEV